MKIAFSYPPLVSKKGSPFLSQNRQFQWTNTGNVIYPLIPAYAASWLHKLGHQVLWDDAIAQKLDYSTWLNRLLDFRPDLIVIESKTPVIKRHWQIIKDLRQKSLDIRNWKLEIVLIGDHVTALPKESLLNSPIDYVATGGDYDFMIKNLVDHLTKNVKLEPGFYYRKNNKILNTGKFSLKHHNLDILPFINRQLTRWQDYSKNNTNYKYLPGTYTMFGRDCWWGKCTFCSWTTIHPFGTFRTFSVKRALDEVGQIIATTKTKEIFDDTGTFPVGKWLVDFCHGLIDRGYSKKIAFGCNMRFGALTEEQYKLIKRANFRLVLYGLESNNQKTLNLINKNTKVKQARQTLLTAKKAGLEPHLTIMIGYPWETKTDAVNTLNEGRQLFKDGLADSLQATRIIPYPGTPLFAQCQKNNWFLTTNWDKYDMRQAVMKSPLTNSQQDKLIKGLFAGVLTPKFLLRKIISVRSFSDIIFLARYAIKFLQKIKDFG